MSVGRLQDALKPQSTLQAWQDKQRDWAQLRDDLWAQICGESDWSERWHLVCQGKDLGMCQDLDARCEGRWGAEWVRERTQEKKAVAAIVREAINMIGRKGAG